MFLWIVRAVRSHKFHFASDFITARFKCLHLSYELFTDIYADIAELYQSIGPIKVQYIFKVNEQTMYSNLFFFL